MCLDRSTYFWRRVQCRPILIDEFFIYSFTKNTLSRKVFETNIYYGGYKPAVQNVISVQGSIDPWHLLGITQNIGHKIEAVFINGI